MAPKRRLALYVTTIAAERIEEEAVRRTKASGVAVTPETAARAIIYEGLGLTADGLSNLPKVSALDTDPTWFSEDAKPRKRGA